MRAGFNLLLWTTSITDAHWPAIEAIQAAGYDGVEVPLFEGTPESYAALGRRLDSIGLARTTVAVIPSAEVNPIGADPAQREGALRHLAWVAECTAALGAELACGPFHSTIGLFSGEGPTEDERLRAADVLARAGDLAAASGVTLALEPLNRFECYFLNTIGQMTALVDRIAHPRVRGMYDSFHANIEEADPVGVVAPAIGRIGHVHLSENDRGVPGAGHIDHSAWLGAVRSAGYDGWVVVESFGRALPSLAAATRIWRDVSPSAQAVIEGGIATIRRAWGRD